MGVPLPLQGVPRRRPPAASLFSLITPCLLLSVLAHCVDSSDSNMASTALRGVADSWELASLHPIQPRPLRTKPSLVWPDLEGLSPQRL